MANETKTKKCKNYLMGNSLGLIKNCLIEGMGYKRDEIISIIKDLTVVLEYCIETILYLADIYDLNSEFEFKVGVLDNEITYSLSLDWDDSFIKNSNLLFLKDIEMLIDCKPVYRTKYYIILVYISALIAYLKEKNISITHKEGNIVLPQGESLFRLLLALFGNQFIYDVMRNNDGEGMPIFLINNTSDLFKRIETQRDECIFRFIFREESKSENRKDNLKFEYILLRIHDYYLQLNNRFIEHFLLADFEKRNRVPNSIVKKTYIYNWNNMSYLGFYNLLSYSLDKKISAEDMLNKHKKGFSDNSFFNID